MRSILLIGTGRVAFHLGHAIKRAGLDLVGICGRNVQQVDQRAAELGIPSLTLADAPGKADIIVIAVSDDAIADVAMNIPIGDSVVMHTSGASDLDKLLPHPHRAVLWPVISLSPGEPMDFKSVPLVIEANSDLARDRVMELAQVLSEWVMELTHAQRELVHTSAAISLNFPLHLLARAQGLLADHAIDPSILLPSFLAMAQKAATIGASEALTGPARRGDLGTIRHHLDRLTDDPELRAAYARLSSMILRAYGHPDHGYTDV
ncbi:MAG TPA: DUF2520 domain-containing protein [Flavobacteriales bacterium]|nr:DUF2520 domain-containing protein [Flavobacteriales bacterium]